MNIQNYNNKIVINPSSLQDVEAVSHLAELSSVNDIVFDIVDAQRIEEQSSFSSCMSMLLGLMIQLMSKGKNIIIICLHEERFEVVGGVINYFNMINA
jgi:hypothetical protein